jgi:pyruvate dehydrogenase E1 component alpha subunit
MGDPERYRSHEEVRKWEKNDPIGVFHKYLIKNKHATEPELEESAKQAENEIQEGIRFAEESPDPAPESLFSDIYVKEVG